MTNGHRRRLKTNKSDKKHFFFHFNWKKVKNDEVILFGSKRCRLIALLTPPPSTTRNNPINQIFFLIWGCPYMTSRSKGRGVNDCVKVSGLSNKKRHHGGVKNCPNKYDDIYGRPRKRLKSRELPTSKFKTGQLFRFLLVSLSVCKVCKKLRYSLKDKLNITLYNTTNYILSSKNWYDWPPN